MDDRGDVFGPKRLLTDSGAFPSKGTDKYICKFYFDAVAILFELCLLIKV